MLARQCFRLSYTVVSIAGAIPSASAGLRRSGLVLGLALVVVTGLGGSASAAVTGLHRETNADGAFDSSNKSATTTCPAGKRLLGAGGEIVQLSGFGEVSINDVIPNAALTGATVQGLEDQNGNASPWGVIGLAICATPPPGLERIVAASPNDSLNKSVTATCPAGKRLLGVGGEIAGGGGQVVLEDIRPPNLTSVVVQGVEDEDGTAANWLVRAFAICANPVAGLERVAGTSATDSTNKTRGQSCSSGKQVLSAGIEIGGGDGQVVVDALTSGGPTFVSVGAFEDENGTASNWFVRAIAICAAVSQRVVATSPNDTSTPKTATADCLPGMRPTGGGGDITGGGGQVLLEELHPFSSSFGAEAVEDQSGFAGDWSLRSYAICATPLPGREVVPAQSPLDSLNKSATVTCPAGKRVVGAGGDLFFGDGVVLSAITPNANLSSVTATAEEDETGTTSNWMVTAFAVCATPPPGLELVTAAGDPDSDPASVPATCPSGKNLLGTGAEIDGGGGQVVLDDVRPNALLTSNTVTALEDETGTASDWFLRAHAICANP